MKTLKNILKKAGAILQAIIPFLQIIVMMIFRYMEKKKLNKFVAMRAAKFTPKDNDIESINRTIIKDDMALYALPLVSEDKEKRSALLVIGKYKSAYFLDLQHLLLDFAPPADRSLVTPPEGSKQADFRYQFSPGTSSIHVFIYKDGKEIEYIRYVIDGSKHLAQSFKTIFNSPDYSHLADLSLE